MQESGKLSNYFVKPKPEKNNVPWRDEETELLLESATANFNYTGEPGIESLADFFKRTDGAIIVKLSKEGWFKKHKVTPKPKTGTLKQQIVEFVKQNPNVFCRDVDKALGVSTSSSTLSMLTKEGTLKRIRHKGNGPYLYSYNEIPITIEKMSEEVLDELQPKKSILQKFWDILRWN